MAADRILVVDDEESIREIVCSMLAASGYRCEQVPSGVEALHLLGLVPAGRQHGADDLADGLLVVNYQDVFSSHGEPGALSPRAPILHRGGSSRHADAPDPGRPPPGEPFLY